MGQSAAEGTTANAVSAPGPGSSAVNIVIPADQFRPLSFLGIGVILALAVALGLGGYSLFVAQNAEREARLSEYYAVDLELCLLKNICKNPNGVPVPADPWGRHQHGAKQ